jgi:hypothetical protein
VIRHHPLSVRERVVSGQDAGRDRRQCRSSPHLGSLDNFGDGSNVRPRLVAAQLSENYAIANELDEGLAVPVDPVPVPQDAIVGRFHVSGLTMPASIRYAHSMSCRASARAPSESSVNTLLTRSAPLVSSIESESSSRLGSISTFIDTMRPVGSFTARNAF